VDPQHSDTRPNPSTVDFQLRLDSAGCHFGGIGLAELCSPQTAGSSFAAFFRLADRYRLGNLTHRYWAARWQTLVTHLGLSIVLTWLFMHTRGSLAMAMLFHFMMDFSPQFLLYGLTTAQAIWSQAIVILAFAFILIVILGPNLQRRFVEKPTIVDKAYSLGRD
jgi:hypothetical protein